MPDISLCTNKNCWVRESCYRAQAKPGMWQSYTKFEYVDGVGCHHWVKLHKKEDE